ncbi:hypothetical protein [Oceanobacillus senegalensis]|uniref:hypothetical protein n=1 Tax=Oceanobacillus senegalensis TaxID=1936063 RepID=UPI001C4FEA86|nr:hypothetical protein [Oceanobacillus senegalensis]
MGSFFNRNKEGSFDFNIVMIHSFLLARCLTVRLTYGFMKVNAMKCDVVDS